MNKLIARIWSPKRKAWVGGLVSAVGAQVWQTASSGHFTLHQLEAAVVLGAATFFGVHTTTNDPPPADPPATPGA